MNEHLQADRRPEPPSLDDTKPGGALTLLGCPLDPGVSKHERVTDVYTGLATFIHHLLKGHMVFSVTAKEEISPKRQGLYQPHAVQLLPARIANALTLCDSDQDQRAALQICAGSIFVLSFDPQGAS